MTRTLDVSQPLTNFDGTPVTDGNRALVLKDVLLAYLAQGHAMKLSSVEEGTAYELGVLIGTAKAKVELDAHLYDLLKKVCDSGKVWQGQEEVPLFSLVVTQQVKRLVDAAVPVTAKGDKVVA